MKTQDVMRELEKARKGVRFSGLVNICEAFFGKPRTEQLLGEKRAQILRIAQTYGARNVRVFGFVARGAADELSDIDFLVELEPGRSLFDLGGLPFELESLLGCTV